MDVERACERYEDAYVPPCRFLATGPSVDRFSSLTRDYVLLASDRQLTFIDGENKAGFAEDHACKLVSF